MLIETETVNKEVEMIKAASDKTANAKLKSSTEEVNVATEGEKKDTSTKQKYLTPPIKPATATYYFDNNLMLARSCDILAEDIILGNKINIKIKENEEKDTKQNTEDISNIINSVESSQVEIAYMCADYVLNGAGCCKITRFEENNEFRLTQIPQENLQIMKISDEKLQATPIYLVEQDSGSGDKKLYKILGETYPDPFDSYDNKELGAVWWIGGDNFYNFYRKPKWLQASESMNSQIALKSLDTEKINKGFNMNNIVFFNKSPEYMSQTEYDELNTAEENKTNDYYEQLGLIAANVNAQKIATELKSAGMGTAVLYEESDDPITMQQATLSDTNYNYLLEKTKMADQEVISCFGIPRERYMINDIKESMNSQKTAAFWEIYTKSLNGQQLIYENGLLSVIDEVYELDYELTVDIEVPMFSQIINGKIDVYSDLFIKGLLTLSQTVKLLSQYISDLNLDDLDLTNPIYEMRFVNGKSIDDYNLDPNEQIEYDNATSNIFGGG